MISFTCTRLVLSVLVYCTTVTVDSKYIEKKIHFDRNASKKAGAFA